MKNGVEFVERKSCRLLLVRRTFAVFKFQICVEPRSEEFARVSLTQRLDIVVTLSSKRTHENDPRLGAEAVGPTGFPRCQLP